MKKEGAPFPIELLPTDVVAVYGLGKPLAGIDAVLQMLRALEGKLVVLSECAEGEEQ